MNETKASIKTIAIVTIYDNLNYGNRLQNYAAQCYLERFGYQTVTLPIYDPSQKKWNLEKIIKELVHFFLKPTNYERRRLEKISKNKKRKEYITDFTIKYIHLGQKGNYRKSMAKMKKCYDYFVSGSDQVWHCWKNDRYELKYFFLAFADPIQRLTLSPSFGFDEFPKKFLKIYKKGLEGFEYLSVREERGAKLIEELTGKKATVLLDPTMLIDTSEWLKILKRPEQYIDDNYIFVYALGGFKGEVKEKVYMLADELEIRVVNIMDINSYYYIHTRPDEFLYWIHNARLVVTDSFHASVFSILFNRPFVVTERNDTTGMGSRFDTLFRKFGIENRTFEALKTEFDNKEARKNLFIVDYSNVANVLKLERQKADEFYKRCFHEK